MSVDEFAATPRPAIGVFQTFELGKIGQSRAPGSVGAPPLVPDRGFGVGAGVGRRVGVAVGRRVGVAVGLAVGFGETATVSRATPFGLVLPAAPASFGPVVAVCSA